MKIVCKIARSFLRLVFEQITQKLTAQNVDKSSFREFLIIKINLIVLGPAYGSTRRNRSLLIRAASRSDSSL